MGVKKALLSVLIWNFRETIRGMIDWSKRRCLHSTTTTTTTTTTIATTATTTTITFTAATTAISTATSTTTATVASVANTTKADGIEVEMFRGKLWKCGPAESQQYIWNGIPYRHETSRASWGDIQLANGQYMQTATAINNAATTDVTTTNATILLLLLLLLLTLLLWY